MRPGEGEEGLRGFGYRIRCTGIGRAGAGGSERGNTGICSFSLPEKIILVDTPPVANEYPCFTKCTRLALFQQHSKKAFVRNSVQPYFDPTPLFAVSHLELVAEFIWCLSIYVKEL